MTQANPQANPQARWVAVSDINSGRILACGIFRRNGDPPLEVIEKWSPLTEYATGWSQEEATTKAKQKANLSREMGFGRPYLRS